MSDVDVRVGDVIDVNVSGKVVSVKDVPLSSGRNYYGRVYDEIRRVAELESGAYIDLSGKNGVTVKVKSSPKPAVGESFDGDRLLRTRWKRGTIIEATSTAFRIADTPARFVLTGTGDWVDIDDSDVFEFQDLAGLYGSFKVLTLG
jgi:hypothetical protein